MKLKDLLYLLLSGIKFKKVSHRKFSLFFLRCFFSTHKINRKIILAGLLLSLCISEYAKAQQNTFPPPLIPVEYKTAYSNTRITVDGELTEDEWETAEVITRFIQKNPDQGEPSSYPTEVRVLFDNQRLYIGAVLYQPKSDMIVKNLERDFNYFQNDLFGIAIDGFLDKRNSLVFQVSPLGSLRDIQVIDGTNDNDDWNAKWDAKTTIYDDRWVAEISIPWNIIRYPEGSGRMGVIFARNIRSLNEFTSTPAVPRSHTVYRMEYGALLTGLTPPPPSTNIQVNPYLLGDLQRITRENGSDTDFSPKIGGDVKWAVNTNSVLDLTFNTDFAQAEADRQVVNLNRFSVFFPEKRQFFLENADLFQPNLTRWIQPFFSRRIGLDDSGTPIPIDAGSRFINQTSKQQIGVLAIRQREQGNTAASNFGVLRYSRNLSSQSRLGGMLTYRNDQSSGETPSHNNFTYTVDGLYRPNPSFAIQGMLTGSYDEGTDDGLAGQLWTYYRSNLVYIGIIEYYNRNYNPAMGLELLDENYIMTSPAINFDLRPDWLLSFIRSYAPGVYGYHFNSSVDGHFLFGYWGATPLKFDFHDGSLFSITIEPNRQNLEASFFPVGIEIAAGDYSYVRYDMNASSNPSAKFSVSLDASFGTYYDGRLNRYTLATRFAPIPHIELEADYGYTQIFDLGINNEDEETHLFSVGPRLALNPKVLFSGLYQWNSISDQNTWNIRFSWEFLPLSYLYLVFNSNVTDHPDPLQRLNQQQYITKISYVHQF